MTCSPRPSGCATRCRPSRMLDRWGISRSPRRRIRATFPRPPRKCPRAERISPRLPDGTFRREVAVNLGKLPGQQGGLADRTQKLEEDLSALGGVVYVWANKDIVQSMNEVKDDLAKPTTAKPTQAEEKRIVEQ